MVGETYYPKWTIVLPPEIIRKVGWKAGIELEAEIKGKQILIKIKS